MPCTRRPIGYPIRREEIPEEVPLSDMPWMKAIIEVLRREGSAMHYTAIAERIVSDGLRKKVGATPWSTVNATITTSINSEREKSPFQRVARGEYILREVLQGYPPKVVATGDREPEDGGDEVAGPIHALGMFWDRESVLWTASPAILGMQQMGADAVDMAGQRGIYLLHDVREVVYAGRCSDRPLGKRLYEHTLDRLKSRWNRFSWFGLCRVTDDGSLAEPVESHSPSQIIAAMEALLIEALEPPQNRRRGEGFSGVEFIQAEDPKIMRERRLALLKELEEQL
jgi:hypothetical protein